MISHKKRPYLAQDLLTGKQEEVTLTDHQLTDLFATAGYLTDNPNFIGINQHQNPLVDIFRRWAYFSRSASIYTPGGNRVELVGMPNQYAYFLPDNPRPVLPFSMPYAGSLWIGQESGEPDGFYFRTLTAQFDQQLHPYERLVLAQLVNLARHDFYAIVPQENLLWFFCEEGSQNRGEASDALNGLVEKNLLEVYSDGSDQMYLVTPRIYRYAFTELVNLPTTGLPVANTAV